MPQPLAEPTTMVLGLGSSHGDDRIGWRIVKQLQDHPQEGVGVEILHSPMDLLHHCSPLRQMILVDACLSGRIPGTLVWIDPDHMDDAGFACSTHGLGLPAALELARTVGLWPRRLAILGVEIGSGQPDCWDQIQGNVPRAMEWIKQRIEDWNGESRGSGEFQASGDGDA